MQWLLKLKVYLNILIKLGSNKSDLEAKLGKDISKIGFGKAMQKKWVKLSENSKDIVVRIKEDI